MVRLITKLKQTQMKSNQFFIGIDVSKPYFDASLMPVIEHEKQALLTCRFENTKTGLKSFDKWLKSNKVSFDSNSLVLIENTGVYHRLLWMYCTEKKLPIHIGNAAHIKWSFGIARGKNDVIDSKRLCHYAFKEHDLLRATPSLNPVLLELKDLLTSRSKLLTQLRAIQSYLKELKGSNSKIVQASIEKAHRQAIKGLEASILEIETEIQKKIKTDETIQKNYNLLTSVPGIGHFTSVYIICCTNNFCNKISGKQLACYAGVVPFEHSSGISVKGKNRVHKMANKELKKLLHLGALVCIQRYPEFKAYYQRKKAEGKHALSILNAVKNKLALRVASVINNQIPYRENNQFESQSFRKNYLLKS